MISFFTNQYSWKIGKKYGMEDKISIRFSEFEGSSKGEKPLANYTELEGFGEPIMFGS